jgi:hypothetical protein
MKSCGLVHRASGHVLDPNVAVVECRELSAYRRSQVDPRLFPPSARYDRSAPYCARDSIRYSSIDLEAARPDTRPDGCDEDVPAEVRDRCRNHAGYDSTPACVDSDDVPGLGVRYQDWNAIGHAHADSRGRGGRSTYDRVGLDVRAGFRCLARLDGAAAVHLFHLDHAGHAERVGECAPFRASFAETVTEPCLLEQCRSQDDHQRP